jgi:adenylate cyclase
MIAFQSARRALLCAIAVQRAVADHAERSPEAPIRVRIGVHTGEALREANDFFGKHVILAARIAGQARGSEILGSSLLKELTESAGDVHFQEPRRVELKGLTGTYAVYPVAWEGATAAAPARAVSAVRS